MIFLFLPFFLWREKKKILKFKTKKRDKRKQNREKEETKTSYPKLSKKTHNSEYSHLIQIYTHIHSYSIKKNDDRNFM